MCLHISVPPKMVEGLHSSDSVQGTDIHLSCKAEGTPAPAFRFYKVQWFHLYANVWDEGKRTLEITVSMRLWERKICRSAK